MQENPCQRALRRAPLFPFFFFFLQGRRKPTRGDAVVRLATELRATDFFSFFSPRAIDRQRAGSASRQGESRQ